MMILDAKNVPSDNSLSTKPSSKCRSRFAIYLRALNPGRTNFWPFLLLANLIHTTSVWKTVVSYHWWRIHGYIAHLSSVSQDRICQVLHGGNLMGHVAVDLLGEGCLGLWPTEIATFDLWEDQVSFSKLWKPLERFWIAWIMMIIWILFSEK